MRGRSLDSIMIRAASNRSNTMLSTTTGSIIIMLSAAKSSASAFVELAKNHANHMREVRARTLNQRGHVITHKIGDLVRVFVPPSSDEAARRVGKLNTSIRGVARVK